MNKKLRKNLNKSAKAFESDQNPWKVEKSATFEYKYAG
jgi:hypothetical protein